MRLGYKIIAGADIASHDIKEEIIRLLIDKGYDVTNANTSGPEHGDFTDAAEVVAKGIQSGEYHKGIMLCGSGIGAAMAVNKFNGVRGALCYDLERAVLAAADNNTNVLCTGGWLMPSAEYAVKMIEAWLLVKYTGRDTEGMERVSAIERDIQKNTGIQNKESIVIGCDVSGYPLKKLVTEELLKEGYAIKDVGCNNTKKGYYIDAAEPVCRAVQSGEYGKGILICGTGQGMNITANKFSGIRSAICYDLFTAKMSRADSDANVLCTGAWCVEPRKGIEIVKMWLTSDYYNPNNAYGIQRMKEFDKNMRE